MSSYCAPWSQPRINTGLQLYSGSYFGACLLGGVIGEKRPRLTTLSLLTMLKRVDQPIRQLLL